MYKFAIVLYFVFFVVFFVVFFSVVLFCFVLRLFLYFVFSALLKSYSYCICYALIKLIKIVVALIRTSISLVPYVLCIPIQIQTSFTIFSLNIYFHEFFSFSLVAEVIRLSFFFFNYNYTLVQYLYIFLSVSVSIIINLRARYHYQYTLFIRYFLLFFVFYKLHMILFRICQQKLQALIQNKSNVEFWLAISKSEQQSIGLDLEWGLLKMLLCS